MKTDEKQTLESLELGLTAKITLQGTRSQFEDNSPMLHFSAAFTNAKGHCEVFDYFVGLGNLDWSSKKVPTWASCITRGFSENELHIVEMGTKRWQVKDKSLLASAAFKVAKVTAYTPDPVHILHRLAMEADAQEMSFEDWCDNLGYEQDSRKAEQTYNACRSEYLRLRKLISAEQARTVRELDI